MSLWSSPRFVFLEELAAEFDPQRPDAGKVTVEGAEQFAKLRDDDKPAVIFSAHLANWEILGVVAAKYGLDWSYLTTRPRTSTLPTTFSSGVAR